MSAIVLDSYLHSSITQKHVCKASIFSYRPWGGNFPKPMKKMESMAHEILGLTQQAVCWVWGEKRRSNTLLSRKSSPPAHPPPHTHTLSLGPASQYWLWICSVWIHTQTTVTLFQLFAWASHEDIWGFPGEKSSVSSHHISINLLTL